VILDIEPDTGTASSYRSPRIDETRIACHASWITRRTANGTEARPSRCRLDVENHLLELKASGSPIRKIAHEAGISVGKVHSILKAA